MEDKIVLEEELEVFKKALQRIKEELYGERFEKYEYDIEENIKEIIEELEKEIGTI